MKNLRLGSCVFMLGRGPNLICFVVITYSYVELILKSGQFAECHINLNFHDTYASLTITRAEEHNRAWLKVTEGVYLSLEAI